MTYSQWHLLMSQLEVWCLDEGKHGSQACNDFHQNFSWKRFWSRNKGKRGRKKNKKSFIENEIPKSVAFGAELSEVAAKWKHCLLDHFLHFTDQEGQVLAAKGTHVFPSWSQGTNSLLLSPEHCSGSSPLILKKPHHTLIDNLALEFILQEILLLPHKHRAPLNCHQNTSP